MARYGKILVAFDGSENGLKALESAKEIAQDQHAHLTVIYVHEDLDEYPMRTATTSKGESILFRTEDPNRNERLGEVVSEDDVYGRIMNTAKEKLGGLLDVTYEKLMGHPPKIILAYATKHDIDLIIVGNRGLGTLKKFFMGSVSQKIADAAKCSILIVK